MASLNIEFVPVSLTTHEYRLSPAAYTPSYDLKSGAEPVLMTNHKSADKLADSLLWVNL